MTEHENERLERLFSAALDKGSESERDAFLDLACGEDLTLRAKITELLDAHARVGSFLDEPPVDAKAEKKDSIGSSETVGSRIGRYKILQKLGEGGFGSVYMAEQQEPVHRRVALKIIKLGMDTKQVIARFEAEQQALAMMDHPNIARVYDAGATETGRPYFVMELVKGIRITDYCDNNKLSIQDRLELMIPVCHAIQHAHQKGIIHRDLKPSNVLIAIQDSRPVPKVIDFGIAKATTQRLTDKTLFTELQQFIGTPEYMSPDQAEVSGLDMDTRTDIYSLGVMIYELLTGTTPFDARRLRDTSYDEIRRVIREEDPPTPSERLQHMTAENARSSSAEVYKEEPMLLARMIRGDLDWIVMKALEKDRTRRYATAKDLSDDLERYLRHEPVLAGPPDMRYKLRKFIRRHRVGVIVGTVVGVAMIVGLSLATVGLVQANRAKAVLEKERNAAEDARAREQEQRALAESRQAEAQLQVAKSTTVIDFLKEMLRSVDPSKALGREVTIRYVLDEAGRKIEEGALADQPDVEADVRMTLGDTYLALGLYKAAEKHIQKARDLRRSLLGDDDPDTLRANRALAGILRINGRFSEAEELLRETARKQDATLGPEHEDTLATLNELALALWGPGRFEEAESIHRNILEIRKRTLGDENPETAKSYGHLGAVCRALGKLKEAEPLLRKALDLCMRVLGEEHPSTAAAMNNLGLLYEDTGRLELAEDLYRQTYELDRKILGTDHPRTRIPLNNLIRVLNEEKKTDALEPLLAERIGMLRRAAEKPDATASALHAYAWELLNCEAPGLLDPESALPMAKKAVRMDTGGNVEYVVTLAQAYHQSGNPDRAIATQQRAVSMAKDDGFYDKSELEDKLLEYRLEQGDLVGAMGGLWEGVADNVGGWLLPETVPDTTLDDQAEKLMAEGRYEEAAAVLRGCLSVRQKELSGSHWHWLIADTKSQLGAALAAQGQRKEAETLLLDAFEALKNDRLVTAEHKTKAVKRIIDLYKSWKKPEKAAEWTRILGNLGKRTPLWK